MDAERIAQIQARVDAATAGPWLQGYWSGQCFLPHRHDPTICEYRYHVSTVGNWDRHVSLSNHHELVGSDECGPILSRNDAAFIAHARADVPDLLAALTAADAERATLLAALGRTVDGWVVLPDFGAAHCRWCKGRFHGPRATERIRHAADCPVRILGERTEEGWDDGD